MKFRSPKFQRLHVHGVGRFVDGVLVVTDPDAIRRIQAVADRYGIHAVWDADNPFDPSEHLVAPVMSYLATATQAERQRVLDAEAAGKKRPTILNATFDED